MPGRAHQQAPSDPSLCRRCRVAKHSVVVRTEPLCVSCFRRYVQGKVLKRMDNFRVQQHHALAGERKLLLPLSLGSCSTALLHILNEHLRSQADRTGRTGYKLCVLHIIDDPQGGDLSCWHGISSRYPDHEYISVPLSAWDSIEGILRSFPGSTDERTPMEVKDHDKTHALFDSLSSPTARSDAARILMRRLIVHTAKKNGCQAIMWGDSTTKLAERTLAETAKGRGFSLPWIVAEGESPQGIDFYHPLQDLLSSEICAYVSCLEPSLTDLIVNAPPKTAVSTKHSTIDDLMQQYFSSVEREYPSIVANVVKTTGKLRSVPLSEVEQQCELCEMPLEGNGPSKSRLCYGCIRTLPSAS